MKPETEGLENERELSESEIEARLRLPEELYEKIEKLRSASYPRKSREELFQLLLWRGLERTERLLKAKETTRRVETL